MIILMNADTTALEYHEIVFALHGRPGALADEDSKKAICALARHNCPLQPELSLLRVLEAAWQGDEHA